MSIELGIARPVDAREGGAIHDFLTAHGAAIEHELMDWVRLPSVAGDRAHSPALTRSSVQLATILRQTGFPRVEVWRQGESPTVYAEWMAEPSAPTVLIYSHHDVRTPAGEKWIECEPFHPIVREGMLFGRGSSDAKGQVLAHIWGIRAHLAASGRSAPAVNLKFLVEGEQEIGSPHLRALLEDHRADLASDLVVFTDTMLADAEHPALCTSVRGVLDARITVHGLHHDAHSGAVSGPAPNPIVDLAGLLARLHDDQGRITLPEFYDRVGTPDADQRRDFARLDLDDEKWASQWGTDRICGEQGYTIPELLWARPAVEVINIQGGDLAQPPRAVIASEATAELRIHTVDGQRADEVGNQLRRWLQREASGMNWDLHLSNQTAQDPYRTPDIPAIELLASAMAEGFGTDDVGRMGNAGGGPADLLGCLLEAPVLFFGTGQVTDGWHVADEHVELEVLRKGAATLAGFWSRLGAAAYAGH
jgi:acetylornithine deacetylase/succinyl-diaminopimelate desuccinylase-like protein